MAVGRPLRRTVDDVEADPATVARIAQGDLGALALLHDRHAAAVTRFVARTTCHSPDTLDIVQDTFLSVITAAARFDGRLSCRPWLLGIAAYHVMHRRRSGARLRRFLERLVFVHPTASDGVRWLEARDGLDATERALAALPAEQRVALVLAEVEGLSGEEIAASLGVPAGTVWRRIFDARASLRRAHAEESKR